MAFILTPSFSVAFGVITPDHSFVTNPLAWVQYGIAFGLGWLLHRQIDLFGNLELRWLFNLVISVGFIFASLALASLPRPAGNDAARLTDAAWLADAICYALAIWTTTFAVIGMAIRFLSGFSAARRYIADASYWVYLIHLPIVMALQIAVATLDWYWPTKFATILLIVFLVSFVSYQLFVRYSVIGVVLNGRRMRKLRSDDKLRSVSQVT
jgi:hypothetical protein